MQAPERCGSKNIVAGYARPGVPSFVGNLPWRYVIVYDGSAAINMLTISADLTPSNILFELTEIDAWSEDTIYAKFGDLLQEPVETTSGEPPGPHAPTYLVEAISASDLYRDMITEHIRIVDFGQSFRCDSPPERGIGIPMSYMAPELLFESIAGTASDLWALGCTMYEIRAGRPLIHMFMGESPEDTAVEIAHTLGAFPTAWNRITFGEEDCEPMGEEDDTKEMRPWNTLSLMLLRTLRMNIPLPLPTTSTILKKAQTWYPARKNVCSGNRHHNHLGWRLPSQVKLHLHVLGGELQIRRPRSLPKRHPASMTC
jgi:serine/threonine protein kinase